MGRSERIRAALSELEVAPGVAEPEDVVSGSDNLERFLLVERNIRGSEPAWWLSTHDGPERAARYNAEQEYRDDWEIVDVVDLDTGDRYVVEVTYTARKVVDG